MVSWRLRLALAFGVFVGALGFTYLVVVPALGLYTEDALLARGLAREAQRLARPGPDGAPPRPAPDVQVCASADALPEHLRPLVVGLPPGVHELQRDARGREVELFVAVQPRGPEGAPFWVLRDVRDLEILQGASDPVFVTVVSIGFGVTALAGLLAWLLLRRLLRDLALLRGAVSDAALDEDARRVADGPPGRGDELQRLVAGLAAVSARNRAALERERRFSRDVSHELRSPITVVRGGLELLDGRVTDPVARRAMDRMASACGSMEELVQAFLWLARAARPDEAFAPCAVGPVVRERLDALGLRPSPPPVTLVGDDFEVRAPRPVLAILVRNLLDNAAAHGAGGPVEVRLQAPRLTVTNRLAADATRADPAGFGFGRLILSDLCARFGWEQGLRVTGDRAHAWIDTAPARRQGPAPP